MENESFFASPVYKSWNRPITILRCKNNISGRYICPRTLYNNAHQDNVFKPRQSSRHCETGPLLLPQSIEEKITKVTNIQDYLVEKMDPIMK